MMAAQMVDDGKKVIKEASMAKLFASDVFNKVADKALQIHGGIGYIGEYAVERFYRDARITKIYEGTNEIQRLIIARKVQIGRASCRERVSITEVAEAANKKG